MTRVLIIDDHPLFREALHSAIALAYPQVEAIDAVNIAEATAILAAQKSFDLILLDLNIPDASGFDGLLRIRSLHPRIPVVVISGHEEPRVVAEALTYGAAGFIPKSARKDTLSRAIREVMDGKVYLPEGFSQTPTSNGNTNRREMIHRLTTLTPQQLRVLQMLREGLLNKQIAYELKVGETTVKAHVSEILRKLKVYSRTQAVIEMSKLDSSDLINSVDGFPAAEH